jgi:hypothetical protein
MKRFLYNPKSGGNSSAEIILDLKILKTINMKRIFIVLVLFFNASVIAQVTQISGVVTSEGGIPLPGVNIVIQNTTTGVLTDFDGSYSINADVGDQLVFSFMGFITQTIAVGSNPEINVILEEDLSTLDEVVITGYSTQLRSTMATSISKLNTKVLESAPRSSAATALQGTIAGLRVTQNTGQPGFYSFYYFERRYQL